MGPFASLCPTPFSPPSERAREVQQQVGPFASLCPSLSPLPLSARGRRYGRRAPFLCFSYFFVVLFAFVRGLCPYPPQAKNGRGEAAAAAERIVAAEHAAK